MALLALSPPPVFLNTSGEPTIRFNAWIRMFDNYVTALSEEDIAEKRKHALLIHCLGTEGQRIFVVGTWSLKEIHFASALRDTVNRPCSMWLRKLLVICDFGVLADDMIRDQIIEKTCIHE